MTQPPPVVRTTFQTSSVASAFRASTKRSSRKIRCLEFYPTASTPFVNPASSPGDRWENTVEMWQSKFCNQHKLTGDKPFIRSTSRRTRILTLTTDNDSEMEAAMVPDCAKSRCKYRFSKSTPINNNKDMMLRMRGL